MQVLLDHVQQETANVATFWFRPERQPDYVAGQFIELTLPHNDPDDRGVKRWFTLSSSPTDELLSITTKHAARPSSFKTKLFGLQAGDSLTMSQAMGDFVLPKDKSTPLLFVIGGIGITPVHSMLRWLQDTNERRHIHVLYATKTPAERVFTDLLESQASVDYLSGDELTTQRIMKQLRELNDPLTYVSGPEEMVEILVEELRAGGVKNSRLVTDYFPGYAGSL